MPIHGEAVAVRVVINLSTSTFFVIFLYFKKVVFTLFSLLSTSKDATEVKVLNFTVFRTVIIFVINFRQLLVFRSQ